MDNTIIKDETTRSRGKFKPAPNLSINEVKNVLFKKIEEETSKKRGNTNASKTENKGKTTE